MFCPLEDLTGFALDLGGTKTAAARFEQGKIITRHIMATEGMSNPAKLMARSLSLLKAVGFAPGDPLGIAVTGRIDHAGFWHAVNSKTLSRVSAIPLASLLKSTLLVQTPVINDAVAAVLGEYHYGAGEGCPALGFITISTGVGGAFLLDGSPIHSQNGLAGHCGFMSSCHADRECGSGRRATVESIASGTAIGHYAAEIDAEINSAKKAFDARSHGDMRFEGIIDRAARAIAVLCGDLAAILGLECVVIGGSVGLAPGFMERIIQHQADEPALFRPVIKPSRLQQDNVLYGALSHALGSPPNSRKRT